MAMSPPLSLKKWKSRKNFFLNNILLFKMFLWANGTDVWHSCRFFCRKSKNFFALNMKFIKRTLLCSKKIFLSKRSSALKESHFDKPSKKSLLKVANWQKGSPNIRKSDKINLIPWICFFQFREGSQKFFEQLPRVCRSKIEKDERIFFWTTLFSSKCSCGLPEQKFGCLADFFAENLNFFLL